MGGRGSNDTDRLIRGSHPTGGQTSREAEIIKNALGKQGAMPTAAEARAGTNETYSKYGNAGALIDIIHGQEYRQFNANCQRCIWAFEFRMRGYDVEALPFTDDMEYSKADEAYPKSWVNAGATPIKLHSVGSQMNPTGDVVEDLKADILDKTKGAKHARGCLAVPGQHVFNWVKDGDTIVFHDGQINIEQDMREWVKAGYNMFNWGRMDNIRPSGRIAEFVKPRSGQR